MSAVGAVGAALLGGWFGRKGEQDARKWNAREAEKTRAFNERMRNTTWQAGVEDMRAAGLNPALAYSQGGAPSPTGPAASGAQNANSSAMQNAAAAKSLALMDAQIAKTRNEAKAAGATARWEDSRVEYFLRELNGSINGRNFRMTPKAYDLWDSEIAFSQHNASAAQQLARQRRFLADSAAPLAGLANRFGEWLPILGGTAAIGGRAAAGAANLLLRKGAARAARRGASSVTRTNSIRSWNTPRYKPNR